MIIIALLAVALLTVALVGGLALVVFCVRSEDRRGQLPHQAPTRITRTVRSLTGLRVCQPDHAYLRQRPMRDNATRRSDCADMAGSPANLIGESASARAGHVSQVRRGSARSGRRSA